MNGNTLKRQMRLRLFTAMTATAALTAAPASAQIDLVNLGIASNGQYFHSYQTDGALAVFSSAYPDFDLHVHDTNTEVTATIGEANTYPYQPEFGRNDSFHLANRRIAFDWFGSLHLHDTATGITHDLDVELVVRPSAFAASGDLIMVRTPSPDFFAGGIQAINADSLTATPLGIQHPIRYEDRPWAVFDGRYVVLRAQPVGSSDYWDIRNLYIYDTATGSVTKIIDGIGFRLFAADGGLLAFNRPESADGTDLNGDGDADDDVLHVYDYRNGLPGTLINLGIANGKGPNPYVWEPFVRDVALIEDGLVISNSMRSQPGVSTQRVFDFNTDPFTEIDLGEHITDLSDVVAKGGRVVYRSDPGTGNAADEELRVYDHNTGSHTTLDQRGTPISLHGDWLVYKKTELDSGGDMNGDGDTNDSWLLFHDFATGARVEVASYFVASYFEWDLRRYGHAVRQSGNLVVFEIEETDTDLTGDGDLDDPVVHAFDFTTGAIANLGVSSWALNRSTFTDNLLAFSVYEDGQDLNGDGDGRDDVAHVAKIFSVQHSIEDIIAELTDIVEEFDLSQGLVNSLNAQLEGILLALNPEHPGQGDTAYERLEALINAVKAQRGKKLTDEQADALIASAEIAQGVLGAE